MSDATKSRVRADIQALRAVAVLAVAVSHFWPGFLPSGFAGVDVFFVVSGFLITAQLVREVETTGRVRLSIFWVRRLRRIFPAALTVIVSTVVVAHVIGFPPQVKQVSDHAIASIFSAINLVLAWESTDYSARSNATSPLQHFWSLAVEEQFYVVWPLAIVAVVALSRRMSRPFKPTATVGITVIVAISLAYAVASTVLPAISYFDSFARAWELGAGAAIAIVWDRLPRFSSGVLGRIRPIAWLLLVVSFLVDGLDTVTPGVGVLPAVVLTSLLIAFPAASANRTVGFRHWMLRLVVWVGDRSFSLYLWHWPALILAPYVMDRSLTWLDSVVVLVFAVVASDLTFRFIENPVRYARSSSLSRPVVVGSLAAACSISLTVAVTLMPTDRGANEFPTDIPSTLRETPLANPAHESTNAFPFVDPHCGGAASSVFDCPTLDSVVVDPFITAAFPPSSADCTDRSAFECVLGDTSSPRAIALVGDSHARMWWTAFDIIGKRAGFAVHMITRLGCSYRANVTTKCGEHNAQVRARLLSDDFDVVVLTQVDRHEPQENYEKALRELADRAIPVVMLADNPHISESNRACVEWTFPQVDSCAPERTRALGKPSPGTSAAVAEGIPVIDFSDIYCDEARCDVVAGGMLMYRDTGHLYSSFVATMAPFLWNELKERGYLGQEKY